MKKNRVVDSKTLARIEKDAAKVTKILEQMARLAEQVESIKEDSRWLNYLGEKSTATLTDDDHIRLGNACSTIFHSRIH